MNSTSFTRNVFPAFLASVPRAARFAAPAFGNIILSHNTSRDASRQPSRQTFRQTSRQTFPAVNIWESDSCYFVEAELPGVKLEDIDLSVIGNELTLRGKRRATEVADTELANTELANTRLTDQARFQRQERRAGSFARIIELPTDVNAEAVEATLKNGVLTLRLPKTEAAKPRKINIAKA